MEHAAHGQITAHHAGHILDVTAEKAVFTNGDAVGFGLIKAKEDADGVGLFSGFQITDPVDNQRTLGVLFEKGPLVKTLSGSFIFKSVCSISGAGGFCGHCNDFTSQMPVSNRFCRILPNSNRVIRHNNYFCNKIAICNSICWQLLLL